LPTVLHSIGWLWTQTLIYKRSLKPAHVYTGMLIVIRTGLDDLVWTVVAGEHGMTGVREAVITAELMNAGALTLASYQDSWAQDPYEPDYTGVDRRVLRYMSDDQKYDERFPAHPCLKCGGFCPVCQRTFRIA
jgi:hypothetical protein